MSSILIIPETNFDISSILSSNSICLSTFSSPLISEFVSIEYSENIQRVKTVLLEVANKRELVLKDHDILVFVDDFEASSIKMGLRVWCLTENYWVLKWDMLESIKNAFDENQIVIPFDQLDVNIKDSIVKM